MALEKDEAVVLGRTKFGDTSLIVTLFTRGRGPVKVIAKGARRARSRFSGALEPTNRVHVVYYRKENRDLQLLSQCDVVRAFPGLRESLLRLAYAYAIIECLVGLKREQSAAGPLFRLAEDAFAGFECAPEEHLEGAAWAFLLAALDDAGFRPELERCVRCGKAAPEGAVRFDAAAGGIVCGRHGSGGLVIRGTTRDLLRRAATGEIGLEISPRAVAEGREAFRRFLAEHGLGRTPFRPLDDLVQSK